MILAASAAEAGTERRVAFAAKAPQRQPAIERLADGFFTVWMEDDAPSSIMGSFLPDGALNGQSLLLALRGSHGNRAPAIARAGDVALAVWIEQRASGFQVLGRRISSAGFVYYESAIYIGADATTPYRTDSDLVSVASNGTQFLVTWTGGDNQIRGARVDAVSGLVLDAPPLVISRQPSPRFGLRYSVSAIWNGHDFYVTWLEDGRNPFILSPPVAPVTQIYRSIVTVEGAVLPSADNVLLHESPGQPGRMSTSHRENTHLIAWSQESASGSCLRVMAMRDSGILLPPEVRTLHCVSGSASLHDTVTAATPTGFVIAWEQRGFEPAVDAMRVNASGYPVDAAPLRVASGAFDPALAVAGAIPSVAYSRVSTEGAPRVFVRSIFDTLPQTRSRAVRRR